MVARTHPPYKYISRCVPLGCRLWPIDHDLHTTQTAHNAANFLESERIDGKDKVYPTYCVYMFVFLVTVFMYISETYGMHLIHLTIPVCFGVARMAMWTSLLVRLTVFLFVWLFQCQYGGCEWLFVGELNCTYMGGINQYQTTRKHNPSWAIEQNCDIKGLDNEVETKWPPFSRRNFQMHFLEWKCMNSDKDFTELCY